LTKSRSNTPSKLCESANKISRSITPTKLSRSDTPSKLSKNARSLTPTVWYVGYIVITKMMGDSIYTLIVTITWS
jgi:hypothetical protein